jgi:hypothetical protein
MRHPRTAAVLAATIVVGVFAGSMSPESTSAGVEQAVGTGGIGLRLTEVPASARHDPRAQVYIIDHLAPGTVVERQIEVSNTTASTQHVAVYAAGASIDDGTFVGAAGHTPNELSSWTSVTPTELDVASDGTLTTRVTLAIPADAPPGEQYGVIWAEARSDPERGDGLVLVSRVGIRMYVSVGPGGAPAADFTIDSVTASRSTDDGAPMISASVHNAGGRALDMTGTLTLSNGPGGLSAGPFAVDLGRTLAIGDTRPVQVILDGRLPAGPWDASITLSSGLIERTAEATITFPEQGTAAPSPTRTTSPTSPWLVPTAGVVALLAACAAVLVLRRHPIRFGRAAG